MTRTRVEADREDLMAEAVNLSERVELRVSGIDSPVTIGCNAQGHWSFYIGPEPMYRFDDAGLLRRAVRDGKLYRTQGASLAELERIRLEHQTELQRRDLGPEEAMTFLESIRIDLERLSTAISMGQATVLRSAGTLSDFEERLIRMIKMITTRPLRLAPAIPTKRT